MFNLFKSAVEKAEIEELNEALSLFTSAITRLEALRGRIQTKYEAHSQVIEKLESEKSDLNTLDSKVHNVLVKLRELVA